MKRLFFLLAAGTLACAAVAAQTLPCPTTGEVNAFLGIKTIRLWAGDAPQAKGKACSDIPTLTIFEPQGGGYANGSSVIVLPGGGYSGLAANLEGRQVADWFTSLGFRAFVLQYRLTSQGYVLPVPLLDARRALQLVRAHAREYQIDPNRIGMIGFSAGGHLAALAATLPVNGNPAAEDPVDRVSSRPDYLILGYPWIGAISSDTSHLSYCKSFNLMENCEALRSAYSPDLLVNKNTPPTFWYHTADDETVPIEQGLRFYEALLRAGVPAEAHLFRHGHHGTGTGGGDPALDQWPILLENWLRAQGLLSTGVAVRP